MITAGDTAATRVLCLGNDLIADDALGPAAAEHLRRRRPDLDVVVSGVAGFYLMDHFGGIGRLVVIDSVQTGAVAPGTVRVMREQDFAVPAGSSPHYVGLFEALALARALDLEAPDEVWIVTVEAADLVSMGAPLTPAVAGALDEVVRHVREIAAA